MATKNIIATVVAGAAIGIGVYYYIQKSKSSTKSEATVITPSSEEKGVESIASYTDPAINSSIRNQAFVFIKPHANTPKTQALVLQTLKNKGINISSSGELSGEEIDKGMLIDQHYYAIASKATILKPKDMPVPADKFENFFNITWTDALASGKVYNALDACIHLGINADELDLLWAKSSKVKFGGGFYCGLVECSGFEPIYVFNAFFMSMRAKFVSPGTSIYYYVIDFDPSVLSWEDFRGSVLGPTDPMQAPADSLRGTIYSSWEALGLSDVPNVGDNGVHASASPFEGLAERMNWLKVDPAEDDFGSALLAAGVSLDTIKAWSLDPQVKGKSIFDQLEDTNAADCIAKCVLLAL